MSTFLISREVELPFLATQYESECFAYVVSRFDLFEDLTSEIKELTLLKITSAAKKCLGEATTTEICGSYAKKTNISGSDIDVYVDTVDPVNLEKRKELTMHLKSVFDDKHVSLGIKSITVFNGFFDVDVVCSNTVEFGVLPRADTTIAANCPANLAIRALKFVIKHARSDKVPGHLLEKFVQFVQSTYPIRNPLGGGGFQLFISILQHVVDCEPSKIVGLPGGTGASANIHRIAVTLVHQYVVSRTLNTTFRSNAEVFGWLNLTVDNDAVETAVGTVPSWLLSLDGMPSPSSPSIGVFKQYSLGGIRTVERSEGHVPFSLNLMQHMPIAKYTLKGKVELNSNNFDDEMMTLQMHARKGSVVAHNMCASRCLWYRGLDRMLKSEHVGAMQDFGESMRLQTIHSDPFSGFVTTDLIPTYKESVRIVLASHPTNIDALLLCARIHLVLNEFKQCSEVLEVAYKLDPDDCYGTISNLRLCFGNTSQWKKALRLSDRCVLLCPLEPIFYYWRAVARKSCIGNSSAHELKDVIDDLMQYLNLKPAPEGRKVANAWYDLAFFRFTYNMQTSDPDTTENTFMKDMHCAMKAEENILPMFRPVTTESKKLTELLFERISRKNPQLNVASRINKLKEIGNAEFKKGEFSVAVYYYTKALEISAGNVDILNNRSAAYSKLCYFSRALEDAEKARDIARENIKSYFRIMTSALGKRKPLIALTAARSALRIQPNEESILKLQLQAETMISELSTSIAESAFQYDPTDYQSAPCWSSVFYKNRVFVVDEFGRTDFANIEDAVFEASNQHDGNGTTIILLPGKYSTNQLRIASDNKNILSVQIIGWNVDNKGAIIELAKPMHMHCTLIVISGKCNVQISNCLLRQPFGLPIQAANCVVCKEGAVVIIENSRLENPDSPCCSVVGENSIIELNDCTIWKASAVVVSASEGLFRAKRCSVKGCYKAAIEIRERGSADLTDCIFSNCTAQAVALYAHGKMLKMLRCKLTYCGKQLQHSAILIETGQAIITESEIRNCPGDAVVVQQVTGEQIEELDPQVIMKKCIIEHNKCGLCFYHGYGIISESKFNFNALNGLAVHALSANRKLVVTGNTFLRNGVETKVDFLVQGKTLFDNAVVLRNDNDFSVAPYIVPDMLASAARDFALQKLHREGMR